MSLFVEGEERTTDFWSKTAKPIKSKRACYPFEFGFVYCEACNARNKIGLFKP